MSKIDPSPLTPAEFIAQYRRVYKAADAKGQLWKWFVLTLKSNSPASAHVQTEDFAAFYDDLNNLLSAVLKNQGGD